MNKFNNKAYTLIELLAVILILAIISLIAVPIVTTIVEESRKGSFKTSVMNSFKAVDTYLFFDGEVEMPELGVNIKDIDTLKPNNFKSGLIFKNLNGNYEVSDVSDGRYCANGELENLVITKGGCDLSAPTLTITKNKTAVTLDMTDDKELTGYVCTNTDASPTSWISISGKTATGTCNFTELGTYYGWVKDSSNNITRKTIDINNSDFCNYNVGQTWVYNYTGGVQSFITPCNAQYKLEVYGAQGGIGQQPGGVGGLGGYSVGTKQLSINTSLYIVVGGSGLTYTSASATPEGDAGSPTYFIPGGYNGGGGARRSADYYTSAGSGGGATHIATVSGTLSALSSNPSSVLIVGGGGGGAVNTSYNTYTGANGGAGGGLNGLAGATIYPDGYTGYGCAGATQSSGNAFGLGGTANDPNIYNIDYTLAGGGGGGYYGGYSNNGGGGGGGGSSYLSPTLSQTLTTAGVKSGHGQAIITLVGFN